jgi:NAD(P)-dependent dehydrogenase (short-subunit alcohol dehydrogenase family)
MYAEAALDAEDAEAVKSQVAAHRFVRPDEIAGALAFLAHPIASDARAKVVPASNGGPRSAR